MKKALILLTSFLTLLVSFSHPSDEALHVLAAEKTGENIITSSFFDYNFNITSEIRDFQEAEMYDPNDEEEFNSETDKLNYALTSTKFNHIGNGGNDSPKRDLNIPGVKVDSTQDIFGSFITQLDNPIYQKNSANNLTFLQVTANEYEYAYSIDSFNLSLNYQVSSPLVYFSNCDELTFYIDPNFSGRAFKDLIKQYNLVGSLVFLQLDDDPILKLEIQDGDFRLVASEDTRISFENVILPYPLVSIYHPVIKVTIPYRASISKVVGLHMDLINDIESSNVDEYVPSSTMVFAFHQSMADNVFFYFFSIKSLSIVNKTLEIEENTYTDFRTSSTETIDKSKMSASLVSMTLYFSGSIRFTQVDNPVEDNWIKGTQISSSGDKIYVISKPETKTLECTFTRQSETSGIWYYETDGDLTNNSSGQLTIQSITFHPIIEDTVREDLTFMQDYKDTQIFKYSFDLKKAARIYYYRWEGYYRAFSANDDSTNDVFKGTNIIATDVGSSSLKWVFDQKNNYHCFGFSFYFDDDKKESIPNVKKIRLKWQCGYKSANSDPDSGGFFPNTKDKAKDIHIAEKEVNANKKLNSNTFALDEDGMFLSDKESCRSTFTQDGRFDYVVAKLRKRGDKTYNSYISQMAPLEIFYETISGETIRMIGNSKGLHVVEDDNGKDIVVDSEGNPAIDEEGNLNYGIFVADDGTKYPGLDKNGDGKITADEVINSDTGEGENLANPDDSSLLTDLENTLSEFLNRLNNLIKDPRSWLLTILSIILIVSIVLAILNPATLITIFKAIQKFFSSLFSKAKEKVAAKRKKSQSKKSKKKATKKSKRKKR